MKRSLWAAVIVIPVVALLASGFRGSPHALSPLLGKPAPSFSLRTLDGKPISLSALRGHPVVLNFWASWCESCKVEHRYLVDAWRRFGSQGVDFVGITFKDSTPDARGFLKARGAVWPSLRDPGESTAIDYGVSGVPETFLIDRRGVIRFKSTGPVTPAGPVTPRRLMAEIRKLVGRKA